MTEPPLKQFPSLFHTHSESPARPCITNSRRIFWPTRDRSEKSSHHRRQRGGFEPSRREVRTITDSCASQVKLVIWLSAMREDYSSRNASTGSMVAALV